MKLDHHQLRLHLHDEYKEKFPVSGKLSAQARTYLVDGGSHSIRLIEPFPVKVRRASGARIETEEGHTILDFWQGHFANILGHNPKEITEPLARYFRDGNGLQTGFTDRLQGETAEILAGLTGQDMVRFTTSGSLATMYSTLLARAYTGRSMVMKVGGGWHGAQPWGLKGVDFHGTTGSTREDSFDEVDTAGLPEDFSREVIVTRFNDQELLIRQFEKYGDTLACFILEPFIGAGGFLPVSREYLECARELTDRYGALLIFDEIISGFRFCPGSIGKLYGITPDIGAYGKIVGGGMPVAAVAGAKDIMELAGRAGGRQVRFSGGTFSAHPSSLLAARTMMKILDDRAETLYPYINRLGGEARNGITQAFEERGIRVVVNGDGNDTVQGSSLGMGFFPHDRKTRICHPRDFRNPDVCDVVLGEELIQLSLLLEDVHVVHGMGSVTAAHTPEDIRILTEACGRAADRIAEFII